MAKHARRSLSPWLLMFSSGLLAVVSNCKPASPRLPTKDPNQKTVEEPPATLSAKEEQCAQQDWTRPEQISEAIRLECDVVNFKDKIGPCYGADWKNPDSIKPSVRELCLKAGWGERRKSCESYDWARAYQIDQTERAYCEEVFGFQASFAPELCDEFDWTKPEEIPGEMKDQCLRISFVPRCNAAQDRACVPPDDPSRKELFTHTGHGIDLPGEPATRILSIKDKKTGQLRKIECADCHSGECKKGGTVDINRPDHNSCSGIGTCHPDFARNKTLCKSCHTGNTASTRPPLRPYGGGDVVPIRDFGFDFSHDSHLSKTNNVTQKRDKSADCNTCHRLETKKDVDTRIKLGIGKKGEKPGVKVTGAGHKECGQCHCDSDAEIHMNDCLKCHTGSEAARSGHAFLQWRPHAQNFSHASHQTGPDGKPVECNTCHISVAESTSLLEIPVPPMIGCLQGCHDGTHINEKTKKPIFDGWVQCAECHASGDLPKSESPANRKKGKK